MPAEPQTDFRQNIPALGAYRAATNIRRAEAFCDRADAILGMEIMPITPATFSLLLATDSRFLKGETPLIEDVVDFLWIHSRHYSHIGAPGARRRKTRALRKFRWAISRPLLKWIPRALRRRLGIRITVEHQCAVIAIAANAIIRLLGEAIADAPWGRGGNGKPLATLEAQMIVEFARDLHWPAERTRHTPLKQLFQLHRVLRNARGEDVKDAGEDAILMAHMNAREAALAADPAIQEVRRKKAEREGKK